MAARIDVEKKKPVPRFFLYTLISIGCVKTNKPRQKKKRKNRDQRKTGEEKKKRRKARNLTDV